MKDKARIQSEQRQSQRGAKNDKTMTAERFEKMRQVLDRRQPDLTVIMEGVHKPHNLAAVLRTCDAVGVFRAHSVRIHPRMHIPNHIAGGAGRWVGVDVHSGVEEAVSAVREQGGAVYAAHLSQRAVDFRSVDYTRPCALLLGSEKEGVTDEAAALADEHVVIPMMGFGASLNVSVAAALALYEAQRQRTEARLYDRPRLDPETYRTTLFEWSQPKVAAYCRRHGLDYPPLDHEGDVLEWSLGAG